VIELRIEESRAEKTPVRLVDSHCHIDMLYRWVPPFI
jgi:hypothetical protein